MSIYSPLHNFHTMESEFDICNYITLIPSYKLNYRVEDDGYLISKIEHADILRCSHWVIIDDKKVKLDKEVILNTLLLAFWVLSPTKVNHKFIFYDVKNECKHILSRFEYNKMDVNKDEYTLNDLKKIKEYFLALEGVTVTNGRLQTALANTFYGCVSFNWKIAFLLYSAAIEAILTYKKGYGITERLAKSYACTSETDLVKRRQEYNDFKFLYNIRSKIMHGEVSNNSSDDNLLNLSKYENSLRKLWQVILPDLSLTSDLEKSDSEREIHFLSIEDDFIPE